MTRTIAAPGLRQPVSPQDAPAAWRRVEARVSYQVGEGPLQFALLQTIDQGPEFRELIFMLEAWQADANATVLEVAFFASCPVPAPTASQRRH